VIGIGLARRSRLFWAATLTFLSGQPGSLNEPCTLDSRHGGLLFSTSLLVQSVSRLAVVYSVLDYRSEKS